MEERAAVGFRHAARDLLESRIDGAEARAQAVYRVVAGKHAALDAEKLDRPEDELSHGGSHAGDLRDHVRGGGKARRGRAPGARVLPERETGVVENDRRVGKVAREPGRVGEVRDGRLQLEVEPERG